LIKYKRRISDNFKTLSLLVLARYQIDDNNEMLNAATALMELLIANKEDDYESYINEFSDYLSESLTLNNKSELSIIELIHISIAIYSQMFRKVDI